MDLGFDPQPESKVSTDLITASRLAAFEACQRKHYWRYEVGLQRTESSLPLRFGTAWAKAMELRWLGQSFEAACASGIACTRLDDQDMVTFTALLSGYFAHYIAEPVVKELVPEVQFEYTDRFSGARVAGKIDGLAILHDGRQCLLESKTTASSVADDSQYWDRLRFNVQLLQYVMAARHKKWNVETIIYDVTRKPAIRPKQNESLEQFGERLFADTKERPEFYFSRREVPVLAADLEAFSVHRAVIVKAMKHARRKEKKHPGAMAWHRSVSEHGCRSCDYAGFCLQNIDIDLSSLPSGFEIGPKFTELAKETTPTL